MLVPMPRSDVYAACTYGAGELHIMRMIANSERSSQIDAVLCGGLVQKMRIGLDTQAAVGSLMGTDVHRRNRCALVAH